LTSGLGEGERGKKTPPQNDTAKAKSLVHGSRDQKTHHESRKSAKIIPGGERRGRVGWEAL